MGQVSDAFKKLREIGSAWDDVICVCRELMKDNPCECNCKEFFDESITNSFKERNTQTTTIKPGNDTYSISNTKPPIQ